ncbi:MAG: LON peptidase substrate-binding domain-containing protein [Alphaproteobacteria bacterium]|nr:LON peptidase substrate-binding domain-containing protein [Alphaproteobacteria bacterium]MCY4320164.1 LON peptidase substrate-binding domain-containing protein [Alphaproteobacteria bacterium]
MTLRHSLPEVIPVFPLAGVLLLPRAMLPLHIFEPRYRAMIRDALDDEGIVGMVQPFAEGADPANPPIYEIGCAGKIQRSEKLEDGRYTIALQGIARFRIDHERALHPDGYRTVHADFEKFGDDLDARRSSPVDRESLVEALRGFLIRRGLGADWDAVGRADDETLVNTLSMGCPFAPNEKQALLECGDTGARARMLETLFAMSGFGAADDDGPGLMN